MPITQKAKVSPPWLFCVERRSFIPCGGRRTDHRIYSIPHPFRFVNTTICGIFYFVDRHTAMAIWCIRATVRISAAARISMILSTSSSFAASIRASLCAIRRIRSAFAISSS
nr:MAG TPA: hypothetical protein [Caudoviricetes sp.]